MNTRSFLFNVRFGLIAAFAAYAFTASSQAVLIDWTNHTPFSNGYNFSLDDGSGENVTVTIANDGGALFYTAGINNTTLEGGLGSMDHSLNLAPIFTSAGQYITVTFAFSAPVTNLSYTLFDIDGGPFDGNFFQDQVLVSATYLGGNILANSVSFSNPSVTETASATSNTVGIYTGNAIADNTGVNSGIGNLQVSYNTLVDTVQIRYAAGPSTSGTASTVLGVYNFSGTAEVVAVPEASSILAGTAVLAAVGVGIVRRSRKLAAKKALCPAA